MSDELNQEVNEPAGEPEVNPIEAEARAQGWVPKEEWNGQGKWRDAEAFLDRGELFRKIDEQRREVRELRKTQEAFNQHLVKVRQSSYEQALEKLRAEKRDALVEGDPDAVIKVDEKIATLREESRAAAETARTAPIANNEPHPDFVAWKSRNSWYDTGRAMRAFADVEGVRLAQEGLPPNEVLKQVEALVRAEFPEKFTNPNRAKASAVEGGARATGASKESYTLTAEETRVMNRLVKSGVMTKEEYIADIKATTARRGR